MRETPPSRLSLVVATVGRANELCRLFDSLCVQSYQNYQLIVVDQNNDHIVDQVIARYVGRFDLIHVKAEKRGHAAANNVGLKHTTGDLIVFPDDDCWYPPDFFERVVRFFERHPEYIGLTGRENTGKWDTRAGGVNRQNIWKRHISFTMFFRSPAIAGLVFDESLGVGAATPWGSGEETDFLLRTMKRGNVYYDPAFIVFHPEWSSEPYTPQKCAKARSYGMGMGRLFRLHSYPPGFALYHCLRPLAGLLLSLFKGHVHKARYHWMIFTGRTGGWLASR